MTFQSVGYRVDLQMDGREERFSALEMIPNSRRAQMNDHDWKTLPGLVIPDKHPIEESGRQVRYI